MNGASHRGLFRTISAGVLLIVFSFTRCSTNVVETEEEAIRVASEAWKKEEGQRFLDERQPLRAVKLDGNRWVVGCQVPGALEGRNYIEIDRCTGEVLKMYSKR